MDPLLHISKQVLLIVALCSLRTESTNTAEWDNQGMGENQGYFFYQQSEYLRDCSEVLRRCSSLNSSGVYVIKPDGYPEPFEVYCENDIISGWTVIQRRIDGSVNYNRMWRDYKDGFGFLSNNYWLGNHKLSYLTNQALYELRVDMELSNGSSVYVTYSGFRISDEWDNYTLLSLGSFASGGDGSITSCPRNMVYGNCTCQGTCEEPSGSSGCHSDCTPGSEGCFCPGGFLMDGDACVPPSDCPCFWAEINRVVPNGQSYVNDDCTERRTCTSNQLGHGEVHNCGANAQCRIQDGVRQCSCNDGYERDGQTCVALYKDCYDVYLAGHTQDGVYTVLPTEWTGSPFNVSCVMSNGGGWTIFQRRTGSGQADGFYRTWASYREGFEYLNGDLWLGNEKLHYLTKQRAYKLRVDIVTSGDSEKYAEYTTFETASERENYRLSVSGYSGNAGNSMNYANGVAFSTYDRDNDGWGTYNCAEKHRGGWWYTDGFSSESYTSSYCDRFRVGSYTHRCTYSNPNGDYNGGHGLNIFWYYSNFCNLNSIEMKIRPAT